MSKKKEEKALLKKQKELFSKIHRIVQEATSDADHVTKQSLGVDNDKEFFTE